MIVYAVYVTTEDGRTILSENFQSIEGISDNILLGGVSTAVQNVRSEIKKDPEINSFEIEGLSYHVKSFGLIRIVLVTGIPKYPEEIAQMLGFRFINEFGDILMQTDYTLKIFSRFKDSIREIIPKVTIDDESTVRTPTVMLGTWDIFNLPIHIQKTTLALISLDKGTIEDIAQESGENIADIENSLTILLKMGFIGEKKINSKTTYFFSDPT
ncbi:MAG: hypothetical protein ACXADY_21630 [Candidatus Hodarchaeales archaeon]|jgi:hypothetical protein